MISDVLYDIIVYHIILYYAPTRLQASMEAKTSRHAARSVEPPPLREMGGAPRNPAPRDHFLVWIVKRSGCHCTDGHSTSRVFTEDKHIS